MLVDSPLPPPTTQQKQSHQLSNPTHPYATTSSQLHHSPHSSNSPTLSPFSQGNPAKAAGHHHHNSNPFFSSPSLYLPNITSKSVSVILSPQHPSLVTPFSIITNKQIKVTFSPVGGREDTGGNLSLWFCQGFAALLFICGFSLLVLHIDPLRPPWSSLPF
ncbi:hypothetical protein Salat_1868400 [Sesamum alatum]|uniref:Uncharacterized protein n=1 Tax=Sesamum alatum TaxID=300844 RepID=A0AAE1Y351_9LAMI|nr:hypothetical protein Salat_1868400 [Sesamum alatum]